MSSDYKIQLCEAMDQTRQNNSHDLNAIKGNIERIEASQSNLTGSLQLLTQQIDQQVQESKATSSANTERWANLHQDAQEQRESLDAVKDATSDTTDQAHNALGGLAELSGDSRLGAMTTKVGGFSRLYKVVLDFFPQLETKSSTNPACTPSGKGLHANGNPCQTKASSGTTPSQNRPHPFKAETVCAEQNLYTTDTGTRNRKNRYPRIEMDSDLHLLLPPRRISKGIATSNQTIRHAQVGRPRYPQSPPPLPQRRQAPMPTHINHGRNDGGPALPPRALGTTLKTGDAQVIQAGKPPAPPPKSPFLRSWTSASDPKSYSSGTQHPRSISQSSFSPGSCLSPPATTNAFESTTTSCSLQAHTTINCHGTNSYSDSACMIPDEAGTHLLKKTTPEDTEPALPTRVSSYRTETPSFAETRDMFEQTGIVVPLTDRILNDRHPLIPH
ncbi:MAG: hypothetical protein Q9183_002354 [Haloplaca sp. 2 TL-2023]